MTRHTLASHTKSWLCTAAIRAGCAVLLTLALPAVSRAQTAARTAPDQPSTNRETHRQHDSLAVHFLRSPKAKPAGIGATRARKTKSAAATDSGTASAVNTTPLPTRARTAKP
jgi:hypothetical protein